jgi:hypothetical protein
VSKGVSILLSAIAKNAHFISESVNRQMKHAKNQLIMGNK